MADSEEKTDEVPKTNLNEHWKGLDVIFQNQLRQYCDTDNTPRFNSLGKELGFNTKQCGFLFDAIKSWTASMTELNNFRREQFITSPYRQPQITSIGPIQSTSSSSPLFENNNHNNHNKNNNNNNYCNSNNGNSNNMQNTNTTNTIDSNRTSSNNHIFAIPSNRNESLSGGKRKRIESDDDEDLNIDSDDDQEYDVLKSPKRKKRKHDDDDSTFDENEEMQHLWTSDANLTEKEQQKLEEDNIYVVEAIRGHKSVGSNKYQYNVKWQGYDDLTWEPPEHLNDFMIKAYWKGNGLKIDKEAAMIMLQHLSLDDDDGNHDDQDYNDDDDDDDIEMERKKVKGNKKKDKDEKKKKKNKSGKKNKKNKSKSKSKTTSPKKNKKENKTKNKNDDIGEVKEYRCEDCNRDFKSGQALGGHNAGKHKDKFEGKNKKKNKKSPKYKAIVHRAIPIIIEIPNDNPLRPSIRLKE